MTPRQIAEDILAYHAAVWGLTLEELRAPDKRPHNTGPRHQAWLDIRAETGWGPSKIGRLVCRDHSTIIYGCETAAEKRFGLPKRSKWAVIAATIAASQERIAA